MIQYIGHHITYYKHCVISEWLIFQLLSGQPPDGEESSTPVDIVEGTTPEQQIVSYQQHTGIILFKVIVFTNPSLKFV